ncbi:NepR family anti-sigma factor [Roseicella frigidaeris]
MAETDEEGEAVDNAFDLWLRRGLHQLYDTVAKEPIPEDLLRMIEDDRKSQQQ